MFNPIGPHLELSMVFFADLTKSQRYHTLPFA